jgi:hypothetical protein
MARRLLYTQQVLSWVLHGVLYYYTCIACSTQHCLLYIYVHTAAAAGHDMEGEGKEVEDLIISWGEGGGELVGRVRD